MSTIQIKRSLLVGTPLVLAEGELAYSFKSDSKTLFIGDGTNIIPIGGEADHTKLLGIEAGAQVNTVTSVAGKTGVITLGTADITGLDTALSGKALATHSHIISDVTGLQGALDAKATASSVTTLSNNVGATDTNYVTVFNAALV